MAFRSFAFENLSQFSILWLQGNSETWADAAVLFQISVSVWLFATHCLFQCPELIDMSAFTAVCVPQAPAARGRLKLYGNSTARGLGIAVIQGSHDQSPVYRRVSSPPTVCVLVVMEWWEVLNMLLSYSTLAARKGILGV